MMSSQEFGVTIMTKGSMHLDKKYVGTRRRQVAVYVYDFEGQPVEFLVPEQYAKELEELRRLRAQSAGKRPTSRRSKVRPEATAHSIKSLALPEDFLGHLSALPDRSQVLSIAILNEAPTYTDALSPGCKFDLSTFDGTLCLFRPENTSALWESVCHGWAHLTWRIREMERHVFSLAASIESEGYNAHEAAAGSLVENWSVHFCELLSYDLARFTRLAEKAPVRTAVLGMALKSILSAVSDELKSSRHDTYGARTKLIESEVLPVARSLLVEAVERDCTGTEGRTALRLLAYLGTESDWSRLNNLKLLDLSNEYLTDGDLTFLTALNLLEELDLSGTAISSRGTEVLRDMKWIKRLRLGRTAVANSSMGYLSNLTALEELDVSNTYVRDDGLVDLVNLSNLRLIDLQGSYVSELGVDMLNARLAKLQIKVST